MISVVFCPDYTSSMASNLNQVNTMIISFVRYILLLNLNVIRISIIQIRSHGHHDQWLTYTYTSGQNIHTFEQWLNNIEASGGNEDECEAIGDALQEALKLFQSFDDGNKMFDKKLAILITDAAPNGLFTLLNSTSSSYFAEPNGVDPWLMANKFNQQDITLAVVGIEPSVVQCDDFYCALAQKTGGQYIPSNNAIFILKSVIHLVIVNGYTFRQAFLCIKMDNIERESSFKYSAVKERVCGMISECVNMNDIRQVFYNYRFH